MPTFHGQTVDVYEDFEDALSGSWAATDPDTNLDAQNAAAKYAGTYGLKINSNGSTAGGDVSYLRYDTGAERTDLSIGFWHYVASYTTFTVNSVIGLWGAATPGTQNIRIYHRKSGATNTLALRGTGFSASGKAVSVDTWYWVTVDLNKNATSTLRVYDTAEAEVDAGTSVTATAHNNVCQYLYIGHTDAEPDENEDTYWDEWVADWTSALFPILGWAAGGGVTVNPYYRTLLAGGF